MPLVLLTQVRITSTSCPGNVAVPGFSSASLYVTLSRTVCLQLVVDMVAWCQQPDRSLQQPPLMMSHAVRGPWAGADSTPPLGCELLWPTGFHPLYLSLFMPSGLVTGDSIAPIVGSLVFHTAGVRAANATQPAICLLGLMLVLAAYLMRLISNTPALLAQAWSSICGLAGTLTGQLQRQLSLGSQGSTTLLLTHLSGGSFSSVRQTESDSSEATCPAQLSSSTVLSTGSSGGSSSTSTPGCVSTSPTKCAASDACRVVTKVSCGADAVATCPAIPDQLSAFAKFSRACQLEASLLDVTAVSPTLPALARSKAATCMLLWLSSATSSCRQLGSWCCWCGHRQSAACSPSCCQSPKLDCLCGSYLPALECR